MKTNNKHIKIFGVNGVHGGKKFSATEQNVLFGRNNNCQIRYAEDAKGISALHCEIKKHENNYVLIDKNSSYGTYYIDGTRLIPEQEYVLKNEDAFYLATPDNMFKIQLVSAHEAIFNPPVAKQDNINVPKKNSHIGRNILIACVCILLVSCIGIFIFGMINGDFLDIRENDNSVDKAVDNFIDDTADTLKDFDGENLGETADELIDNATDAIKDLDADDLIDDAADSFKNWFD